jgi:hypothetical protein
VIPDLCFFLIIATDYVYVQQKCTSIIRHFINNFKSSSLSKYFKIFLETDHKKLAVLFCLLLLLLLLLFSSINYVILQSCYINEPGVYLVSLVHRTELNLHCY